ncbi:MAG: nucleoside triphosphate pyrophosphohydrolase, partial [Hyphomicrobium sp.]
IETLRAIMKALRTPGPGCPWDLEQSFATIAPYTIEEAYEVADAIQRGDLADLKDELGDLLLQVVYHSRMAEEQGAFTFDDVADAVARKMIRRHPHVFGTSEERAAGAEPGFWERLKAEEKAEKATERAALAGSSSPHTAAETPSLLDDTPLGLPALTRAIKLQNKAARVGFDWPSLAPVFDKMREELAELEAEVAKTNAPSGLSLAPSDSRSGSRPEGANKQFIEEEFGDLLFVVANVARHLELDPEAALRAANAKFTRRFQHIEKRLSEQGRAPAQSTLEEMDALWDEAKAIEKGK